MIKGEENKDENQNEAKEESKDGNKDGKSMHLMDARIYEGLWVSKYHRILITYKKFCAFEKVEVSNNDAMI